jgi:hypothetical protein
MLDKKEYAKAYYQKNKEKLKEYSRQYYKNKKLPQPTQEEVKQDAI